MGGIITKSWVAVKELRLKYHNSETILCIIYCLLW